MKLATNWTELHPKLLVLLLTNIATTRPKSTFNWVLVRDFLGVGSSSSMEICRHAGINPHDEISTLKKIKL